MNHEERKQLIAQAAVRVLAHAYRHDSRPPEDVVDRALAYPAGRPPAAASQEPKA